MFRKAVDDHNSLGTVLQDSKQSTLAGNTHKSTQPAEHMSSNALRQTSSYALNSLRRPVGANSAIKRTANGLAKAIGSNPQSSFDDGQSQYVHGSQINPVVITEESKTTRKMQSSVFFDENDFDSDLELEIENPISKQSAVQYPKLPTAETSKSSVTYPTLQKASLHTHSEPAYHPQSSQDLPWSSSPPEHKRTPPQMNRFSEYTYKNQNVLSGRAPIKHEPEQTSPVRPPKRRTLPWLDPSTSGNSNQGLPPSSISTTLNLDHNLESSYNRTPATKTSVTSSYPWNTTASAIKEQQKQLRKANKKSIKQEEDPKTNTSSTKAGKISRLHLSAEQRHVLDIVADEGASVFFTGSAGTGKSVLLREIIAALRKKNIREPDRIAITASTGLAACNIGGVTLHSFAGIGLGKEEVPDLVKKIKRNQKAKHRWMRTKILIIDEVSMVDGDLFDKLEAVARAIRVNARPFGGIQVVITGDFFQLPPVPESGRITKFSFDAQSWSSVIKHTIGLHHVFRQKDPVFAGMLNEMREGRMSKESIKTFKALERPLKSDSNLQATELFPTRTEVERANNMRMAQLHGTTMTFAAHDGGSITDADYRQKILSNFICPQVLELKKGAQVMLIKNIDEQLVNGSLGKVVGFMDETQYSSYTANEQTLPEHDEDEDIEVPRKTQKHKFTLGISTGNVYPVVQFTLADGTDRTILCTREPWKHELPNGEVQVSRTQVPLILAWALSIHKAQGQTLDRVKVDLGKVFEKGQAYVALSRCTSMQGLQVLRFDPQKVMAHEKVRTFYASLSRAEQIHAS